MDVSAPVRGPSAGGRTESGGRRLAILGCVDEAEAKRRLWQLGDLVSPMAVRVAATLRLPDHIADGADTAAALAERTGGDPGALGRLLRHLVSLGVLTEQGGRFALGELGEAMREGHGGNRGPLALDVRSAVGRISLASVALLESVRTGRAAYPLVHGRGFWDDLAADPALGAGFDEFMGGVDLSAFVDEFGWNDAQHVVDVGGGNGTRLIQLLSANPRLRGTLVELPGPAGRAATRIAGASLTDRVTIVARSFFEPLPGGADVYVLSSILHDWSDADATAILRRCAEAAGASGRVLVVERLLDSTEDLAGMTGFDLFMLVGCGGRERTLEEFQTLGRGAGLLLRSVLEGPAMVFVPAVTASAPV